MLCGYLKKLCNVLNDKYENNLCYVMWLVDWIIDL